MSAHLGSHLVGAAPDSIELAEAAGGWRSAYVHIPFCRRRCPYCDFAVVAGDEAARLGVSDAVERYVDALVAEIGMEAEWGSLDCVNFGGGTPSTLSEAHLVRILSALRERFGIAEDTEVSIEANPEDWSGAVGEAWRRAGVTRVSWGVQSFDPDVLASLGRAHTPDQAADAVEGSRAAGFAVSLDLIYGDTAETATSWRDSVATAMGLGPHHLSAYSLTVERGTELSRRVAAGAAAPDPDIQADRFEHVAGVAGAAGLVQYEVSNFARPGHVARYNLATWAQGEYAAFGLGAHGHRDGVRRRNLRRLDRYLEAVEAGRRPTAGEERLSPLDRERERLILGLRRRAGVEAGPLGRSLAASPEGRRLLEAGILRVEADRLIVLDPLRTDAVSLAVMAIGEE